METAAHSIMCCTDSCAAFTALTSTLFSIRALPHLIQPLLLDQASFTRSHYPFSFSSLETVSIRLITNSTTYYAANYHYPFSDSRHPQQYCILCGLDVLSHIPERRIIPYTYVVWWICKLTSRIFTRAMYALRIVFTCALALHSTRRVFNREGRQLCPTLTCNVLLLHLQALHLLTTLLRPIPLPTSWTPKRLSSTTTSHQSTLQQVILISDAATLRSTYDENTYRHQQPIILENSNYLD